MSHFAISVVIGVAAAVIIVIILDHFQKRR